ncbi:MAG: hypothetical protein KF838_11455 [Phycisphaeraceae bacterium]|nr:MAG: hypothetical protein KF838_11455 [Phycisphaeraceae bacterium]
MSHPTNESGNTAQATSSSGFKYFVPGLIVGFIVGGVVGVLLPEFADRGGPRLEAPRGTGQPRIHDEESKMRESEVPQAPSGSDEQTSETPVGS